MPPKHNKKSSSTTRQIRSVTRARNFAARPSTPSGEDVSLPGRNIPSSPSGEDVSPRRNTNTTLSSRYVTTSLNSLSPRRDANPGREDDNNIPALRRSENPSSYIPAPSNILSPRRTASPGREHSNGLASRYVPTPPNILDSRRATNSAREHSPLSFRQTATNPARELNSFSFRHPATPLNASNPPGEHSLFSFHHPSSPHTASSSRRGSSPPRIFNAMQASHCGRIPPDVNDTRHPFSPSQFHNTRLASNTASTPPSASASLQAITPGLDNVMLATPPVPTPLLGRSSPRFRTERQASFPNPTTLNNMSPQITFNRVIRVFHPSRSPPRFGTARPAVLPTPHNPRQSPGFHNATPFSPPAAAHISTIPPPAFLNAIPPSSPVPTPLNSRRPPRLRNASPLSLPLPTPLSGMSPRYHNASLFSDNGPSPPSQHDDRMAPRSHNAGLLIHDGASSSGVRASPRTDDPPSFRNNLEFRYLITPPRQSNVLPPSVPPRVSINLATEAISPRQHNAFDTTVDLTDSPLVSPALNTTVDLSDSPMAAALAPPSENSRTPTPGSFLPPDNSPATPGTSPIKCPVCLDSHGRILLSGRKLMSTVCGHIFCSACLPTCINSNGRCPTCRRRLRNNDVHPIHI